MAEKGKTKDRNSNKVVKIQYKTLESLQLLMPLATRDKTVRLQSIDAIIKTIVSWLDGIGSPFNSNGLLHIINGKNNVEEAATSILRPLVQEQLPDILRLSIQCPFKDVREKFTTLLEEIEEYGLKIPRQVGVGPSHYISEVVPVDTTDSQTQMLFVDAFLQNNRLEHVSQVMGYHPNYLDCFLKTQHYLLRGDGPLPFDYRHYIAIMASSRHQCDYLVSIHTSEFLLSGGEEKWLLGLQYAPAKLQDLSEINKILAHRPWLIERSHIERLTKGNNNWSLSEVMHAIILLSHFHALSSFIFGCGINPEIDHLGGHTFRALSESHNNNTSCHKDGCASPKASEGGIEQLMLTMKKIQEDMIDQPEEELIKRFQNVETQSEQLSPITNSCHNYISHKYVQDPDFLYQDFFTAKNKDMPTFRAQDFSWEDQGYSLANRLYTDIGTLLDEKFRVAETLTYYTMGDNSDVDTTSFRNAIWNYIHCMFGIRHDDYDYGQVNQLLARSLKSYVKTVTCYPERTHKKVYEGFMREFKNSEKVHVNLMLLEARFQAELLYALRAINQYMT